MRHPKGLYLLFFTEMWERFSYYGMRALLVLYLTKTFIDGGLGFSDGSATMLYGIFTGFVYFSPLIGGWIADNYIGQRKSIIIGSIVMILGQFILASGQNTGCLYTGLIFIIIGNGFFKPNISVLLGSLYPQGDSRRDSAFTIFYMGINTGAFLAPLLTGYVAVMYDYRYGFLISGLGLLIGSVIYLLGSEKLLGDAGKLPSAKKNIDTNIDSKLTSEEKDRTWVIVVLTLFAVAFFAGFEQAGSSMTLYADKFIDRVVFDKLVPTEWFQAVNPLFIITIAPLMSMLWGFLSRRGKEPSVPVKMGYGLILLGLGFMILLMAVVQRGGDVSSTQVKANIWFLIGAYFLHTVGELCLSPIGLSMVTKLSPLKLSSLMMGVWLASSAVANLLAGFLATFASKAGASYVFIALTISSVFLGLVLIVISRSLIRLSHNRL
ncbi:MAG: MFS transporter [Bacteroidia bacterium]|nr:MFS transporter [Bacteroidia bacterium]